MYTLPDLDYDYNALERAMSAEILELHHSKHHAAYVKGANETHEKLAEARDKGDFGSIVGLEKTLAFHTSGHALHTVFWKNLSPNGGGEPQGELATAIDRDFGSFDKMKAHMSAAANSLQGSGWGALFYEPLDNRLIVSQIYDHHSNVAMGTTPLLVFDMWEHSYYLQYKNVKADYVKNLWDIVNWDDVAMRLKAAEQAR